MRARSPAEELHLDRNVAEAEAAPLEHAAHLVHQRLRLRGLDAPMRFRVPLLHATRLCGELEGSLVLAHAE